jgi:radical SAM superfamily enzyme YgiQ (UPF0313 family)
LKKIANGNYVRLRSPENIIDEIKNLYQKYPSKKEIFLEIETFGADKIWMTDFCTKLELFNKSLPEPLSFGVNLRITPKLNVAHLFPLCQRANIRQIKIGLESGSEKIRRDVLRRDYSNEHIIHAVQTARQFGLQIAFYNMIGIPGEMPEDFNETIRLNRLCQPDIAILTIFYPYPGTDLYFTCKKQGLIDDVPDTRMERQMSVLEMSYFPKNKIHKNYYWFEYHVYKGYKPTTMLLLKVLLRYLKSKPWLNFMLRKFSHFFILKFLRENLVR